MSAVNHTSDDWVGKAALEEKGRWLAYRYLILRRVTQVGILLLFLSGPWFGVWIAKGNLSSSMTLGVLPLTDPFALAQVLMTRHWPELTALVGVALALVFYAVVGGRIFCSWVCPVNMATDGASWLRRRLGLELAFESEELEDDEPMLPDRRTQRALSRRLLPLLLWR